MANYSMSRSSLNKGQIFKDGIGYDVDASSITSTWRAVQWNGTEGNVELCNGVDYDVNTGDQTISNESELNALATAWQSACDAEQVEIEALAVAAAQAELDAQTPG